MVKQIYGTISKAPTGIEYEVKASYIEVYMERILDLLDCMFLKKENLVSFS